MTPFLRSAWILQSAAAFLLMLVAPLAGPSGTVAAGRDGLVEELGVVRGICVVLGDPECEAALKLVRRTELVVYVQLTQRDAAEHARRIVDAAGFYGTRIYVDHGPLAHIHLADNVADALLALGEAEAMPETEALRVIHPGAKAWLGARVVRKPEPNGIDHWTHPYHGPDNNPVSTDQIARVPYLTQFLADPRYAPLPQLAVEAGGRVIKVFGHIAFKPREEPWLDTMAAFNGYNGTLLWKRPVPAALMVHRNTLIATDSWVYFGDDSSCKVIDAATGELRDEIVVRVGPKGDTFWKWMALETGVLYAMLGEQEDRDPVVRAKVPHPGWPWEPLSPGYNRKENTWGFGSTLVAIDPATKKILWRYEEKEPIDSRGLCMKNGRIYAFRFGAYLTCIDAKSGQPLWRKTKDNARELFAALGDFLPRQDWRTNWRTTAYVKCNDRALYFAGPPIDKLLAVSTDDGRVLWQHPYNNYQLVLYDDALYGVPGIIDKDPARKFDLMTGKVLAEIALGRRSCARVTGSADSIFCRADEGSARLDRASDHPLLVSPMRPQCHDGVTVANGLLYWWPSVCDCNLSLTGITCLGPAGNFDFSQEAVPGERLETGATSDSAPAQLQQNALDWPMYRANATGTATTEAKIPERVRLAWQFSPAGDVASSAPTAAEKLVYCAGSDGIVRALDAATGKPAWKTYTGGAVRCPPTLCRGRALVGSADGWAYCFDAATGQLQWRFRAAPIERRIPVYGQLQSTWPLSGQILSAGSVAYLAAGIINYDGTHLYALDVATGQIKWQNNTSGHLDPEQHSGVSVQGAMILAGDKLYLPGGNAVSPGVYNAADGRCLNDPAELQKKAFNNNPAAHGPRGNEAYLVGNDVVIAGEPLYSDRNWPFYDKDQFNRVLWTTSGGREILFLNNTWLLACDPGQHAALEKWLRAKRNRGFDPKKPASLWEVRTKPAKAVAVGPNAVVLATSTELIAYDSASGKTLWTKPLLKAPIAWGLAVNRDGTLLVTLEDGQLLAFAAE